MDFVEMCCYAAWDLINDLTFHHYNDFIVSLTV